MGGPGAWKWDNYLSTLWFEGLVETMWCCTDLNISVVSAEKLIEVLHSLWYPHKTNQVLWKLRMHWLVRAHSMHRECNTPSSLEQILHIVSIAPFLIYWQHANLKVSRFRPHSSIKLKEDAGIIVAYLFIVLDTCKMLLLSLVLRLQSKKGSNVEDYNIWM